MKKKNTNKSVRLPNYISPISYKLTIRPDMDSFVFSGNEIIKIKIKKDTNIITLHCRDIDIETAKIKNNKKQEQFATKIKYDIKNETVTLEFKQKIQKGTSGLSINFSGIINDNLRGFYKSKYTHDGKDKFIATTQFEATDARRCFPCFDEPSQKAVFDVSLIIPNHHTAISNTLPIEIKEHESGYKIISFSPTPKMSTYLLAFIVGEFECVESATSPVNKDNHKTIVRVFTTPDKIHQAKFALDVAIKCVEFYNDYFQIPYPLPTLDLIAIPDFESAAMENWGAITFRETAILVDDENTSLSNKQWVAIVIAHEIAHQWFGNLVTMHWWTDLWLNEGFASYMETFCIDKIFPHWHMWNTYIADRYSIALRLDSLKNSHPIEVNVNHPNEISEIFDTVSYAKGSVIIRMLAVFIGEAKFRKGLQHYLKKHSYNNTKTTDLWNSFEKVSGKPIAKMMNSWTSQTGYPIIKISQNGNAINIEQERFFLSRIYSKNKKIKKQIWNIPLSVNNFPIFLNKKNTKISGFIDDKINKGETSMVRVLYSEEILAKIGEKIDKLPTVDRLAILRDLFALSEAGFIKTETALSFASLYKNENEYIVWVEIISGINHVYNNFIKGNKKLEEKYNKYVLEITSLIKNKISWTKKDNEKHTDTLLRSLIISTRSKYEDKDFIENSRIIFNNRNNKKIDPDIRGAIYNTIAQNGTENDWENFKKLYLDEKMHEEKDRIARAMTNFKDEKILLNTFKFALSNDVRPQDAPFIIAGAFAVNEKIGWRFMKNNWKIIIKRYGEGGHFLSRLLSPLGVCKNQKLLKEIKIFFKNNIAPGAERALLQSYEKIESNIAWIKSDMKNIENWLNSNYK